MKQDLILLVEDDPDDEELTRSALREHGVGRVACVRDGVEALEYLGVFGSAQLSERPRVILLDIKLPRLDGIEVLRRIRAHPATALIPVVLLTSSREEQDLVRGYSSGANSYIRKPIDFNEFREVVRQLGIYWLDLNEPAHR